jgi:hypothetical protein
MAELWVPRVAVFLTLALMVGCATYETEKKMNRYDYTIHQYEKAIRWGSYDVANSFRKPDEEGGHAPDFEWLKQFAVTSYEVVNQNISEDRNEAQLTVDIRYYDKDTMKERQLVDRQRWRWDAESDVWILEGPLPAFK